MLTKPLIPGFTVVRRLGTSLSGSSVWLIRCRVCGIEIAFDADRQSDAPRCSHSKVAELPVGEEGSNPTHLIVPKSPKYQGNSDSGIEN